MVKTKTRILALDVSGSCTGWSYAVDDKLISWGKYIQKESEIKGKKLAEFANWLCDLLKAKKPTIILIERPYRGRNSNVLVNLSKFIAVVELSAYVILKMDIQSHWFRDPRSIKKLLKVAKGRDYHDNKKLMVQKINQLYNLKLKYNLKKSKTYNDDDIADSIAILAAYWEEENQKNVG